MPSSARQLCSPAFPTAGPVGADRSELDLGLWAKRLTAKELMSSPVTTLPPVVSVRIIVSHIRKHSHQSFPLVPEGCDEDDFPILGVVTRKLLLVLVLNRETLHRLFLKNGGDDGNHSGYYSGPHSNTLDGLSPMQLLDLRKQVQPPIYPPTDIEKYIGGIPEEEMEWLLDLRPFAQVSPAILNGNASATQVHHTFSSLGCHEVFVAKGPLQASGVITRREATHGAAQLQLWRGRQAAKTEAAIASVTATDV